MTIVEIKELENGSHRNQGWDDATTVPDGYAVIPDGLETPNFPFGKVFAREKDGVMTVVKWVAGEKPEPVEVEEVAERGINPFEQLRADIDYLAIMTGVEL